jgi:hypothetical protein
LVFMEVVGQIAYLASGRWELLARLGVLMAVIYALDLLAVFCCEGEEEGDIELVHV